MSRGRAGSGLAAIRAGGRSRRLEAALVVTVVALVVASVALQARWLDRLSGLLGERMRSSLESATLGTAERLDLELLRWKLETDRRLAADNDAPSAASAATPSLSADEARWVEAPRDDGVPARDDGTLRAAVEAALDLEAPSGGGDPSPSAFPEVVVGAGPSSRSVSLDADRSARLLFPAIEREIGRQARVDVTIEVVHSTSGRDAPALLYRSPAGAPSRAPDLETPIFTAFSELPGSTGPSGAAILLGDDGAPRMTFLPAGAVTREGASASAPGWTLRVWRRAGSLEGAIAGLWWRNVGLGALLTSLLAGAGLLLAAAARARERDALARAAVLAGISHELRTPLTVIRSASENLASGVVREADEVAEYGRLLEHESERLSSTVESTLRFARELGGAAPVRRTVDLSALAREAAEAAAAPTQSGRVAVAAPESVPCAGDAEALRTAISNLVRNALLYSPAGSPVEVRVAAEPRQAVVTVEDRGPGIPAAERRRVLEPFERGEAAVGSSPGGAGLGLTLARLVARRHGGDVTIAEREGGGTRVSLVVARAAGSEADRAARTHSGRASEALP